MLVHVRLLLYGQIANTIVMNVTGPEKAVEPKRFSCMICRTRKIRCDKVRPSCSTCTRNNEVCEYIAPRRKRAVGRRNIKALEDRLLSVEEQLNSQSGMLTPNSNKSPRSPGGGLRALLVHRPEKDRTQSNAGTLSSNHSTSTITDPDSLQSDEQLPNIKCMGDLNQLYFDKVHPAIPVLHKYRYLSASASHALHSQPSIYLRYAVWTIAATMSEIYEHLESQFYQRARKYVQADEMSDSGQGIVSMDHVRFWAIIAEYETRKMSWNRAWTSIGRISRLCQLIGLHCIDDPENPPKHPALQDWTDCEAGRRLFWYAYCMDRYSAVITGRPLTFNEEDILTNLPSTEASYLNCKAEITASLAVCRRLESTCPVSQFGIAVICASVFGDLARHMHKKDSERDQNDLINGAFWTRHWNLDAEIVKLQIVFPQMSRSRTECEDFDVLGIRIVVQALLIGLYRAAAVKAEKFNLDDTVTQQSTARCAAAAEEVAKAIQRTGHAGIIKWPAFTTFCVHMAIDSLAQSVNDPYTEHQSRQGLQAILTFLLSLQKPQPFLRSLMLSAQKGLKRRPVLDKSYAASKSINEVVPTIEKPTVVAATSQYQPNVYHSMTFADTVVDHPYFSRQEFEGMPSSSSEALTPYDMYFQGFDGTESQHGESITNMDFDLDPAYYQ